MESTPPATPNPAPGPAPDAPPAGPSRFLLGLALAFFLCGLGLTIYVILHRPEYVVVVGMDRNELAWLQPRMDQFAERHHARIALQAWTDRTQLERLLARDRAAKSPRILVVDLPFDRIVTLADSNAITPLGQLKGLPHLDALLSTYPGFALAPTKVNGHVYALPTRLRSEVVYYSKAHVADAHAHWETLRPQINAWLKAANGHGLPDDFAFEDNPQLWDSYDVFVAAAYWASQTDAGMKIARVAHVVAPEEALTLDLATRADAMGASNAELLDDQGERLGDALAWESMFFRHALYHPAMMKERWKADDVLGAIAQGQVWMATIEARDAFRLRGLPGQNGFVKDVDDMGIAAVPKGASLVLLRNDPGRVGDAWSARTGYGWAVPASCPDPDLAAALLTELTSDEATAHAAATLGWIPPRNGVEPDLDVLYRDKRSFDIARVAAKQMFEGGHSLPESPRWEAAQPALARLWEKTSVREQRTSPLDLLRAMTTDAPLPPPSAAPGAPPAH